MPQTTVAAIVTQPGDPRTILLTRRHGEPFKGHWCLPGGHMDLYEPARKAVIREVKEETGLDVDPRFVGYFDEIIPGRQIHAVVIVFAGAGTGTVQAQPGEVSEIRWFSVEHAQSLPLAFAHNAILDVYVQG